MAETTEKTGEKKLSVTPSKTLSLKGRGVEQGVVRQSFSHGRTKAVVVEKVKSRVPTRAKAESATPATTPKRPAAAKPPAPTPAAVTTQTATTATSKPAGGMVLRSLTEEEQKARVHALNDARLREAEERKIAEEEAFVRSLREAAERTEREAAEARKADEERRRKHDLEAKVKAEQEAKKRFGENAVVTARPGARPALEPDEDDVPRTRRGPGAARPTPAPKPARGAGQKNRGRLTLVTALSADEERERSVGRRSWRHHPTLRGLPGDCAFRQQDHVHRHAGPRRLQRHACARCQGDGYCRAGGRRRRRRHAANGRGDKSRQSGESADDYRDQQDRSARCEAGTRAHRIAPARGASRVVGGPSTRCRGLGDQEAQPRPPARDHRAPIGNPGSQGQSGASGRGHRHRGKA